MSIYKFNPEDAWRFARERGIEVSQKGNELIFRRCPYCQERTTKRNKFAINLQSGAFNCLRASCGVKGNMIKLHYDFGFSLGRDADAYYDRGLTKYRKFRNYIRPIPKSPAVDYLASRGISKGIAEKYGITTKSEQDNILVFPFEDEYGDMRFVKYRKMDFDKDRDSSKEWCERDCKPILFGMAQCDLSNKTLIMTEGQIDSLSVAEAGLANAVSVPTGANGFTWVPHCWNWLCKFDELIVFGDYEHGKITLLEEMRKRFNGVIKHVRPDDYQGCKDANELLLKFGKDAIRKAINNAVRVEHPRIKEMADVKRKDLESSERFGTGLPGLNKVIGGFYFGNLIILTGERGFGKSTLGSQFVLQALRNDYSAFIYSGELMDWMVQDWIDRQAVGSSGITEIVSEDGHSFYSLDKEKVKQVHLWYTGKLYVHENNFEEPDDESDSLLSILELAIKQYGCRVLMVDNLMTAMTDDVSSDLYRQQSVFVWKLFVMAKIYDVLIFLVVHPRKSTGFKFSNDDIAGSSNITNFSDIILRYSKPDPDENDPEPYDRLLQVTKNRNDGQVDFDGIKLWFEMSSKRISDNPNGFEWEVGWEQYELDKFYEVDDYSVIPFE